MRNIFIVLISFLMITLSYAQDAKDWGTKPTSYDNPSVIYTPGDNMGYFEESFEDATFPPAGWTKLSPDGGTGWTRITAGTTPIPGWNGGVISTPPGGGTATAFCTWNTGGTSSNNQFLVTPQIQNVQAGDSLVFWSLVPGYTNASYLENLDVLISTTGTAVSDFSVVVEQITWPAASADTSWHRRSYNLTDFVSAGSNVYVAFREHVANNINDGAAVLIDLVSANMFVPVELASFSASVSNGEVVLSWLTASETNNSGFEVQRKTDGEYQTLAFVDGYGTTTNAQNYTFTDKNLQPGSYTYRLKQIDYDGTFEYSNEVEVDFEVPSVFSLSQNYPNPFNPSTKISFALPVDADVTVKIFNVIGEEIQSMSKGVLSAGTHNLDFNAQGLNSGVYFYSLEAVGIDGTSFKEVKKMMLTK